MRYSNYFPKTLKTAPSGAESINHQLLVRAGFIDQLMAGSWTLLPLGFSVVSKINDIIREELNKTGAWEMQMPLLHPKEIWARSGRWDDKGVEEIMYRLKDDNREFCLSFTHEEIVMDLLGKHNLSYKDLPIKVYQFSTKFRKELRAKSGILRGREFLMKDLYSAHFSEEDLMKYYEQVKAAYVRIFERIGFDIKVVEAAGGVFTDRNTHEFQVFTPVGEDTVYYCEHCQIYVNEEIYDKQTTCSQCGSEIKSSKAIEVGNIFPLGTKYSEKMGVSFVDEKGERKPLWYGSYGIGPTRVMGTLVEVFHDEKGIIWPESMAPFKVHLVGLDLDSEEVKKEAEKVYEVLKSHDIEVLYDDRLDTSPGAKFADSDLIGIPHRLVVSKRNQGKLEHKKRSETSTRFINFQDLVNQLQK